MTFDHSRTRRLARLTCVSPLLQRLALAAAVCAAPLSAQAGLTFTTTFDAMVSAAAQVGINAALAEYTTQFTDNVNIKLKFINSGTGLGTSLTASVGLTYSNFYSALMSDATSAADATALARLAVDGAGALNPVNGTGLLAQGRPALKAMGMDAFFNVDSIFGYNNVGYFDGVIDLNLSLMNLDRVTIDPNKYDLKAVTQHEVDEVMGTISNVGNADPRVADLFRFDAAGNRSFTGNPTSAAYFSIDGTTQLAQYNQSGIGDYGDWVSCPNAAPIAKVQDACSSPGGTPNLGVELTLLDVIGWDRTQAVTVPEPGSLALVGLAVLGLLAAGRRKA